MILRRLSQHVKDQNWFAVGLDFLIVVLGILIAFQITNWADERSHAEQHERYYQRLKADFTTIDEKIDDHIRFYEDRIGRAEYILDAIRTPEDEFDPGAIDRPRFESALEGLGNMRIPVGESATYTEMVAAGQLSAIKNEALQERLAEYDRQTSINLEVFRATYDVINPQIPIVWRHFKIDAVLEPSDLSGIRNNVLSYDLATMRADPEFDVAVMIMKNYMSNNLGVRQTEKQLSTEILALISEDAAP
ncbi:hypothetical protein [Hyphomonas sp.]|uniref:hypothetical protein n=1 Tax=Hyphomonas sp. TaxID=87 RepID=UPI003F730922|tara:strand:+ start:2219 stop:2962 length:744 start_codon:yes stop_codon:yes gene_type:complete